MKGEATVSAASAVVTHMKAQLNSAIATGITAEQTVVDARTPAPCGRSSAPH